MISYPRPRFSQLRQEVEQRYRILEGSGASDTNYLARTVALAFGTPMVFVALNERYRQWFSSQHGVLPKHRDSVYTLCSLATLADGAFQVEDLAADPYFTRDFALPPGLDVTFFAGVPLADPDGKRFGTLCLLDPKSRCLDERGMRLLTSFGHLISTEICIRSAARYAVRDLIEIEEDKCKLYDLAMTDPLTSALNRRAFFHFGDREVKRAGRHGTALTAVMFDIDHFKQVNDTYGHAAGDEVISRLARLVIRDVREEDYVGRMGGEEFCLLLPETSYLDAVRLGNRLRLQVKREVFLGNGEPFGITISLGVSSVLPGEKDLGAVLDRADRALYRSKRNGRDRVEMDLGGNDSEAFNATGTAA